MNGEPPPREETLPDEEAAREYFHTLSNWGRWGSDDMLGTLNHVSADKRREAAALVSNGRAISCSRTISPRHAPDNARPLLHFMIVSGEGASPTDFSGATDWIGLAFHGLAVTHIDALSHCFWNGQMYNGRPASLVTTARGSTWGSIESLEDGIFSKGVLFDMPTLLGVPWLEPGAAITPAMLDSAENTIGAEVSKGDVLLVRTGRDERRRQEGPFNPFVDGTGGLHPGCLPWIQERQISVLVSDVAHEVVPALYDGIHQPIHAVGIVAMGLWLLDNALLEQLSEACAALKRWEFLFTCSPLLLKNTTGSPVNPVAIL